MLSSSFLDIAIGIVFVFLLLSLIASTINEIILSFINMRGKKLLLGLQTLLNDTGANVNGLVARLYNQGQIFGLFVGDFDAKKPGNLPAYIPSKNFVMAMLDVVPAAANLLPAPDPVPAPLQAAEKVAQQATQAAQQAAERATQLAAQVPPATADPVAAAQAAAAKAAVVAKLACWRLDAMKLANNAATRKVGVPLLAMIDSAPADIEALKSRIEDWYNSAMDRISGWYKYHTQKVLLLIGLGLAIALNADTINIVLQLSRNPTLRESVVATATAYQAKTSSQAKSDQAKPDEAKPDQANNSANGNTPQNPDQGNNPDLAKRLANVSDQISKVEGLGIPLGWPMPKSQSPIQAALGWLLTAIAVSLGAPFWFDILNKFMIVRSTVKPGEKSHLSEEK